VRFGSKLKLVSFCISLQSTPCPPCPLWSIPLELCLKAIPRRPWLKNGSGEDADPPSRHSRSTPIILLSILHILSSCLKISFRIPLAAKPHYLCSLTRSLPLISPVGPTFGCSSSKAPSLFDCGQSLEVVSSDSIALCPRRRRCGLR
jgi:hypothetical protein